MKHPKKFEIPGLFGNIMKGYQIPYRQHTLFVIASTDRDKWEHVSVHGVDPDGNEYTPSWDEMCFIKDLFFHEEEVAIQIHPKRSQYVNAHKNTLHLWRDLKGAFELPSLEL